MIKIFIIDDHPVVSQGLATFIGRVEDMLVCGEAKDACAAVGMIGHLNPDIIIADMSPKDWDSSGLSAVIKSYPGIPLLILASQKESGFAEQAIGAGARGYVMMMGAKDTVVRAIHEILAGNIFIVEDLRERPLGKLLTRPAGMQMMLICPPDNRFDYTVCRMNNAEEESPVCL